MTTTEEICLKGSLSKSQVLLFGQIVSLSYFGCSAFTSILETKFLFSAPNFTSFCLYTAISLFLVPVYFSRRTRKETNEDARDQEYKCYLFKSIPLKGCWKAYALAGLVDYAGTWCAIVALQFTTLTSFTIVKTLSTPAVMVFSKCFLHRKYRTPHLVGVLLCIIGVIINVIQDSQDEKDSNNSKLSKNTQQYKLLGDMMAVSASFLYAFLDILCEYILDEYQGGSQEYLGASALFTALFAIGPALVWEWDQISSLGLTAGFCLALLVLARVTSYYLATIFLEYSESALLNLSTLTENLWAVLFSIVLQHVTPAPLFFLGLAVTISGMVLYQTSPSPIVFLWDNAPHLEVHNMKFKKLPSSNSTDESADSTFSTCGSDQTSSLEDPEEGMPSLGNIIYQPVTIT